MNILALDVGTSSVKAAVLDTATAQPIGPIARAAYDLDLPVPEAAEVPADRLWQATAQAGREAMRRADAAGKPGREVQAVGISCLMPALVLIGKDDRPLTPIWTHLDRRSRVTARRVWGEVGQEFLAEIGNKPLPGGISAMAYRQMIHVDPYLTHTIGTYLHANGWLALRMTGEKAFDKGNACFTGLFGTMTDRRWSPRWCDYFEVDPKVLPPVIDGADTVGTLRPGPANELGVPTGLPVKMGTADTSSAMLAADMRPGDLLHVVGTTQVLAVVTKQPLPGPQRLTRLLGVGDDYIHVTHNPVGGVALDWLHDLCFRDLDAETFYGDAVGQALERKTRVTLDPPFLGGDRLEIEAQRAAFRDLELATDRLDLLAALLEAMKRRHRQALEDLGQGTSFERLILTGGGADVVRRLVPEYLAGNVETLEEGSLRGVARLFGRARG